jgi:hypothetical protein
MCMICLRDPSCTMCGACSARPFKLGSYRPHLMRALCLLYWVLMYPVQHAVQHVTAVLGPLRITTGRKPPGRGYCTLGTDPRGKLVCTLYADGVGSMHQLMHQMQSRLRSLCMPVSFVRRRY